MILFDGGASIGLRRFREAAVPVVLLGLPGTFVMAGLVTGFAHWALGIGWMTAGLIGAAVAPTDPAVMFSVLGDREIEGRTDTILEGESGANDPVGIALMLGLIELATHADETFWVVVRVFALQMGIGLLVGIAGGFAEARLLPRLGRSAAWISLAFAAAVFGVAALAHGSGFLAVFVAGLIRGDVEAPRQAELLRLRKRLATVAEVVVFVALGLTIEISGIGAGRWAEGLLIAAFAALLARARGVRGSPRPRAPRSRRARVPRLGRPEGRGADPARRVHALAPRRRGAADLRDGLRRRARVGRHPGLVDPLRRTTAGGRSDRLGGAIGSPGARQCAARVASEP